MNGNLLEAEQTGNKGGVIAQAFATESGANVDLACFSGCEVSAAEKTHMPGVTEGCDAVSATPPGRGAEVLHAPA